MICLSHLLHCRAMQLRQIVAHNLRAARVRRQMSQQALAAKAGISVSYVSMLERAQRSPPIEMLEVLADALGVAPMVLLDGRHRQLQ